MAVGLPETTVHSVAYYDAATQQVLHAICGPWSSIRLTAEEKPKHLLDLYANTAYNVMCWNGETYSPETRDHFMIADETLGRLPEKIEERIEQFVTTAVEDLNAFLVNGKAFARSASMLKELIHYMLDFANPIHHIDIDNRKLLVNRFNNDVSNALKANLLPFIFEGYRNGALPTADVLHMQSDSVAAQFTQIQSAYFQGNGLAACLFFLQGWYEESLTWVATVVMRCINAAAFHPNVRG